MAYTIKQIEDIFDYICTEIESGRALRNVLKDDNMPDSTTFYRWLDMYPDKSKQYARATEVRAEALFDEMLDIADYGVNDTQTDENGNKIVNHDVIQRSRLRIDTRKWIVSKLNPKKYGDKLDVTSDNKPIQATPIFDKNPLSD